LFFWIPPKTEFVFFGFRQNRACDALIFIARYKWYTLYLVFFSEISQKQLYNTLLEQQKLTFLSRSNNSCIVSQ
jgi:hypothetical protein